MSAESGARPAESPALAAGAFPFRLAVLCGAFLLFLIQPLAAKQILPWFGGGPAVWSSCLLFFQFALVGGYAWADAVRRLDARRQVLVHLAVLVAAAATLPIIPSPAWKPPDPGSPSSRVLALLAVNVGLPFVLLAATAPLVQHWHARALPSLSPYRLYVLSNAGSLLALFAYPLVVEPLLALDAQAYAWSAGFVVFVGICGWCGARVWRLGAGAPADAATGADITAGAPSIRDQASWLILPAMGSALLLATTSEVSQNVAALPLLWIVPLAIYLLTFILAFADRAPRLASGLVFVALSGPAFYLVQDPVAKSLWFEGGILLLAFAAGCLFCHGELARRRPPARHLTEFYLAIGIGGGLGGAFVAVAAPLLFTTYLELPVLYLSVLAVVAWLLLQPRRGRPRLAARVAGTVLAAAVIAGGFAVNASSTTPNLVARERNFYGVLRIVDDPPAASPRMRRLLHGQILHGTQFIDPARTNEPTTYFARNTGLQRAFVRHPVREAGRPMAIGAIGLGVGTIAAWGEPGDRLRFYELDPDVIAFARRYFSFIGNSKAAIEIVPGDGRLSLEREVADGTGRGRFDLLVVDAFSGDAIPVHLLTREAFALYRDALGEGGVLALHISNRYLDLRPVIFGGAAGLGWRAIHIANAADNANQSNAADWVLVSANPAFLPDITPRPRGRLVVWTDAFSSLAGVLR